LVFLGAWNDWFWSLFLPLFAIAGGFMLMFAMDFIGHLLEDGSDTAAYLNPVSIIGRGLAITIVAVGALAYHQYWDDRYSELTIACMQDEPTWDASDDQSVIKAVRGCIYSARHP
jgi:hypothetical protein